MAPYILRLNTRMLLIIIAACIIAKSILYTGQTYHIFYELPCADGLLNGIFPLEIGVFLAGAVGYRLTKNYLKTARTAPVSYSLLVCVMLALSTTSNILLYYMPMFGFQAYLIAMIALIPALFIASQNNSIDRSIGELSYPLYLSHYFILTVTHKWGLSGSASFITSLLLGTFCASIIVRFVEIPLNQYRHSHFRKLSS
jgi:peptidoglycan/LPS O-acetylase OafA/YrhL